MTDDTRLPLRDRPSFWLATGTTLLLLGLPVTAGLAGGLAVFVEAYWPDTEVVPFWGVFLVVGSPMFVAGIRLINRGRQLRAAQSPPVGVADPRAPVLLLRSFADDERNAAPPKLAGINPFVMSTREENFVEALQGIGPVIAIGRPGELLPPLGAQRIYVDHAHWQTKVKALMEEASLVVLSLGASQGLWWEIKQALIHVPPARLLLHGAAKDFSVFLSRAEEWLPRPVKLPRLRRLSLSPPEYLMYFDDHGEARFVRPRNSATLWRTDVSRPLLPVYRIALRPVFEQLGVPWSLPPVPWRATLILVAFLCLFFGILFWLALAQAAECRLHRSAPFMYCRSKEDRKGRGDVCCAGDLVKSRTTLV